MVFPIPSTKDASDMQKRPVYKNVPLPDKSLQNSVQMSPDVMGAFVAVWCEDGLGNVDSFKDCKMRPSSDTGIGLLRQTYHPLKLLSAASEGLAIDQINANALRRSM